VHKQLIALFGILTLVSLSSPRLEEARAQSGPPAPSKVYVGLFKDNAVAVVDPAGHRVLATIPVPPGPHGLVITPDGRKVYVSSDGASTVSVIDTTTDRVVASVDVGANPHGLAISRDGRAVLVSGFGADQALIVDTTSDRVIGQVRVAQPHNAAFSPDGRTAFVGSQRQGATAVVVLDLVGWKEIGRIPLDRTPRALDVSPDGRWLYLTVAGSDAVRVIDVSSRALVGQIAVGASPHLALFTPDGAASLVVSQGPGELAILDPSTKSVKAVVTVGTMPHWVAASGDGRTAYVANEGSNDVSVVDLQGRKVLATVAVGQAPRKIAVQPGPGLRAAGPAAIAGTAARPLKLGSLTFADHGTKDVSGQAAVEVEADDYYFSPTFIRGVPGQTLTLEIENESSTMHNLSVPGQAVDRDVPPKQTVRVDVVFPASGVVAFHCKFHSALGMNGELLAGEAAPQALSQNRAGSVDAARRTVAVH
jgi:YVTN family beta-propeller protein